MAVRELVLINWFLAFTHVYSYNCDGKRFDLVCGDNGIRFKNPCCMTHYNFYNRADIRRSSENLCAPKSKQCTCDSITTCKESSVPICGYNLKTAKVETFRNFCHFTCEANCRSEISFQNCGSCTSQSSEHNNHQCLASTIKVHGSGPHSHHKISSTTSRKSTTKRRSMPTKTYTLRSSSTTTARTSKPTEMHNPKVIAQGNYDRQVPLPYSVISPRSLVKPTVSSPTSTMYSASSHRSYQMTKSQYVPTQGTSTAAPSVSRHTKMKSENPSYPALDFHSNDTVHPIYSITTAAKKQPLTTSSTQTYLYKHQSQVYQHANFYDLTIPVGSTLRTTAPYVGSAKSIMHTQGRSGDTYSSAGSSAVVPRSEPVKHQQSGLKQEKPYPVLVTVNTTENMKETERTTTTHYTTTSTRKVVTLTTATESSFERFYRKRVRQPDHYHFYQLKPTLVK